MIAAAHSGGVRWKEGGRAPSQMGVWGAGVGCRLCGELGWREQEEEEMSDSGRWRRGLRLPNWIPEALESAPYTNTHEINETLDCVRGGEEDVEKTSSAAQPRMAANKGLMPSGGPWAELLHYPGMDESIRSNYINHTEISPLFLWKQIWVIPHKSMPNVKYSCMCDVSLSNGHVKLA